MSQRDVTADPRPRWVLRRINSSTFGWGIFAALPPHQPLVLEDSPAICITKWEGRQTLGLLGLSYTVDDS